MSGPQMSLPGGLVPNAAVSDPAVSHLPTNVGEVHEVTDSGLPEIRFVRHLPGFPGLSRYALVDLAEAGQDAVLFELRSLERPEIRFMVAVPGAFFPDYEIELDAASCEELGLADAGDALVLVVLTVGNDLAGSTANLLAPVVVNARTRAAAQVILSGSDWPVRAAVA